METLKEEEVKEFEHAMVCYDNVQMEYYIKIWIEDEKGHYLRSQYGPTFSDQEEAQAWVDTFNSIHEVEDMNRVI
jgi:hypothetical protein